MKRYDVKASNKWKNLMQGCTSHLTVRELQNLIYVEEISGSRKYIKYRPYLERKYRKLDRCSARHGVSMAMAGIIENRMTDITKNAIRFRLKHYKK